MHKHRPPAILITILFISLLLPRLPKLSSQCYPNELGNFSSMGSNKEIQPDSPGITKLEFFLCSVDTKYVTSVICTKDISSAMESK